VSTEITAATQTALAIRPEQTEFTEEQATVLRHLGVSGNTSQADAALFFHVAKRSGLDPFAKQIYMIERQGKQTIQTGIDGFRLIGHRAARAAGERVSIAAPQWAHEDGSWRDLWPSSWGTPLAARVTISRNGAPFTAVAMYDEYVGKKRDGALTSMWASRPAGMLAKCAEALAWRMAFPQDLSGLYTVDELQHTDVEPARPRRESAADVIAAAQPPAADPPGEPLATQAQQSKIGALMKAAGITERDHALTFVTQTIGRVVASRSELTKAEAGQVIETLEADAAQAATAEPAAGGEES